MNAQFKKGVLDLVVMVVVSQHDIYGYELVKRVCEVVEVNEGTIYPLLKRMTNEKYFDTYLVESTEGPPRKYYRITALGLTTMNQLKKEWLAFSKQLNLFLEGELTMTKKEFLNRLEIKLHLLKHDEIQDILDEYSGYIDNKLEEGKTEDEAVADFGNLDDLAREILSAYKIDDKYTHDKSRDIIDNVVDVMTQGIESVVSYFTRHFNDLSVEAVIRLIALILIGLIVVGLMKIPFSLLESLTTSLISVILPVFLAVPLNIVVRLAINLFYLCLVFLLMASFIKQGLENKEITLKELFQRPLQIDLSQWRGRTSSSNHAKKAQADQRKAEEAMDTAQRAEAMTEAAEAEIDEALQDEDLQDEALQQEIEEPRILEDPIDPLIQPRSAYPYYNNEENEEKPDKKRGWGIGKVTARLMIGIVQLITLLILIPFGIGEFVFCFAFGLLVFMLFQGAKLWGVTLMCLGLIGIFQAVVSALWRIVHPAAKKRRLMIPLIVCLIVTGIGVPLMMVEFSRYEEVPLGQDFPQLVEPQTIHLTSIEELERVYFSFYYNDVVFRANPELDPGNVQLTLPPGEYAQRYGDQADRKSVNIVALNEGSGEFKTGLEIFLRAFREGKWYTDEIYRWDYQLIIEANPATIDRLTLSENQAVLTITD